MLDAETARQVEWRHVMNPQPVRKIANMRTRMKEYRAEMRRFIFWDMPLFAVIGAAVVFPGVYFLMRVLPTAIADSALSWWQAALVIWLTALVPPIMMFKPERPSEQDILDAIALRRQVGMDDTLEP